jgi:hypothetical protein
MIVMGGNMRTWLKSTGVVVTLVLFVVDGLGVGATIKHSDLGYVTSGLATIVLAIIAAVYTRKVHLSPFKQRPGSFPSHQVPDSIATTLLRDAQRDRRLAAWQAKVFALAVTEPAALRQRVVEDYKPDRRTLHQTVTVQVQIPTNLLPVAHDNSPEVAYFPALLAEKGELHDDFDVFVESDSTALVLSYREYLSFASTVLHGLLIAAFGLRLTDSLPPQVQGAELTAIMAIMRRRQPQVDLAEVDYSGARQIESLHASNMALCNLAARFVRKLTTHYAIVTLAPIHYSGRFTIRYQQVLIPGVKLSEPDSTKRLSLQGWLRQALGAKPVEVAIELDNASTCQSYHLRIAGPEGMYLAAQIPTDLDRIISRQAKGAPTPPYCRFRRRLGQAHVHFYARYFPEKLSGEKPRIKFRYFEAPPGSTSRASITAAACLILVWLAGAISVTSGGSYQGSDIPALLLAFPALAATWLGFDSPSGRLFEGTLSARCCLVVTAVLSLGASALFVWHYVAHDLGKWPHLPYSLSFLGITDLAWAALVALALLNFVHIGYKAATSIWRYAYLSSRNGR